MFKITGPQNPAVVEQELGTLVAQPNNLLQLPVHPKQWWFGGEAGLVQLVITWARLCEDSILVTHVRKDEDPESQLESMSRRLFGFVSLLMANDIVDLPSGLAIRDLSEDVEVRSLRPVAYEQCRKVVEMMFQPVNHFALGSKVYLACVDHSTLWTIPWLYSPTKTVRDRIEFISLAEALIAKTTESVGYGSINRTNVSRLGAILHELFKNTDEWAKTDSDKVPWRRSIRGMTVERHSWSIDDCIGIASDNPALRRYFGSFQAQESDGRHRFLEITVFDSGLGLARQWLRTSWDADIDIQEEYDACRACLTKHQTSSRSRDRGLGLVEVMSTLNSLRGFVRVRTGRLSMYRDFSTMPLQSADDVKLCDFNSASDTLTGLAPVYGTHYQMLIPLLSEENE